jgi:hypothetical protein
MDKMLSFGLLSKPQRRFIADTFHPDILRDELYDINFIEKDNRNFPKEWLGQIIF